MNKELEEALSIIENSVDDYHGSKGSLFTNSMYIIKSALKRKEKLEKAWKIVEEKKVDFRLFKKCDNVNIYNYWYAQIYCIKPDYMDNQLVETEFNLLKEMLEEK